MSAIEQANRFTRPSRTGGETARLVIYLVLSLAVLAWAFSGLEVSRERVLRGLPQMASLFKEMFFPPDWSYTPKVLTGLRESLQIAALGTAIAAVLALPFGALAARNLIPLRGVPFVGKTLLNMIRTFPELVLALVFIKALGPGPFAGVLAVGFHSIGMIGKLYAERIETVDKNALEALAAAGASPLEVFRYGVVPEVLPDFLSFALYRFDLNVRAATVLGLVGAGGIGTLIQFQINNDWPKVGTILVGIIITVGLVDFISAKFRSRLA
ncbi:MAG: phosphonate ABC transporter, permease protein PhnE [Abitibacteriaceae bacterium]|nr:phosphonate ABC transporter, permease protein PhnE [Abditibacteriaceae bacterium]